MGDVEPQRCFHLSEVGNGTLSHFAFFNGPCSLTSKVRGSQVDNGSKWKHIASKTGIRALTQMMCNTHVRSCEPVCYPALSVWPVLVLIYSEQLLRKYCVRWQDGRWRNVWRCPATLARQRNIAEVLQTKGATGQTYFDITSAFGEHNSYCLHNNRLHQATGYKESILKYVYEILCNITK